MDTISIYDVFGVERGATSVEDHPQFPNPRSDQGDLKELARGVARSGRTDTPLVLWARKAGEKPILLDGKRRITAWLRFGNVLRDAGMTSEFPVLWWKPAANNGMTAEQEAWAYMIRQNSQNIQGRKFLTFEEEIAAVTRLKKSGLTNAKIGDIMGYSRETIGRLLQCKQSLAPNVRKAVTPRDARPTPEQPLSKTQAIELADKPLAEQQQALAEARTAAKKLERRGQAITHKGIAEAKPRPRPPADSSALEQARAAARQAVTAPPPKPRLEVQAPEESPDPDKPLSALEMLEKILELMRKTTDRLSKALGGPAKTIEAALDPMDLVRARQYGLKLRREIEKLQKEAKRK